MKLEADVFRREMRCDCLCGRLLFAAARFPQVADPGSWGGGISLYLVGGSDSVFSRVLDVLRFRVRLSLLLIAEARKDDSVSLGDSFSSGF